MADVSVCGNCGETHFEPSKDGIGEFSEPIYLIRCQGCGTVVGAVPDLDWLERKLDDLHKLTRNLG